MNKKTTAMPYNGGYFLTPSAYPKHLPGLKLVLMTIITTNGKTWAMTDEEKRQFSHMQTDIDQIKITVNSLVNKVDQMYFALMGNQIAQDGGLVGRIKELETDVHDIKEQLVEIKADASKSRWHVHVMWGTSGAVAMALLSLLLSYIFKK